MDSLVFLEEDTPSCDIVIWKRKRENKRREGYFQDFKVLIIPCADLPCITNVVDFPCATILLYSPFRKRAITNVSITSFEIETDMQLSRTTMRCGCVMLVYSSKLIIFVHIMSVSWCPALYQLLQNSDRRQNAANYREIDTGTTGTSIACEGNWSRRSRIPAP